MLPYLKSRKTPRIAQEMDEKLVQGSASDHLEDHCVMELMDAIDKKDIKAFRSALEALVLNCFQEEESENASY